MSFFRNDRRGIISGDGGLCQRSVGIRRGAVLSLAGVCDYISRAFPRRTYLLMITRLIFFLRSRLQQKEKIPLDESLCAFPLNNFFLEKWWERFYVSSARARCVSRALKIVLNIKSLFTSASLVIIFVSRSEQEKKSGFRKRLTFSMISHRLAANRPHAPINFADALHPCCATDNDCKCQSHH